MIQKSVFISHSSKDVEFTLELTDELELYFGKERIFVDYHELLAGDNLASVLSKAIGKAKWFILIASETSMNSKWVNEEARLAIHSSIEKSNFGIITIKLDNCKLPEDIRLSLESRKYIDLIKEGKEKTINDVIEAIETKESTIDYQNDIFVNRGTDLDNLELFFRKTKVLYLAGWHGMGKTSIIKRLAEVQLGIQYIKLELTPGHDEELLLRNLLSLINIPQPDESVSIRSLNETTFFHLTEFLKSNNVFVFLDEAENLMDAAGEFRPFIKNFIKKYREQNQLKNPLVISLIQKPDLSLEESKDSDIYILKPLKNNHIDISIRKWYKSITSENLSESLDLDKAIEMIGGYPAASKYLASYFAFHSTQILKRTKFQATFRKNVAEYIIRSFQSEFSDLDNRILQVIAVSRDGISVSQLIRLSIIKNLIPQGKEKVIDKVYETIESLSRFLLLEFEGEEIKLHPFLNSLFDPEDKLFKKISNQLGNMFFSEASNIIDQLDREKDGNRVQNLNAVLIKYVSQAKRLLMISGDSIKSDQLPYKFSGHIREVVLTNYQKYRNYPAVIDAAKTWLKIEPNDSEILIYQARAFRKSGKYKEAEKALNRVLKIIHTDRMKAIVSRELGFTSRDFNDLDTAIYHFENGASYKKLNGEPVYPLVVADLASSLIRRAGRKGLSSDASEDYIRGEKLYRINQKFLNKFDEIHLPAYIDSLIGIGNKEKAVNLLSEALIQYPENSRLNLKMADLISKSGNDEEAIKYAKRAKQGRHQGAIIKLASLYIDTDEPELALKELKNYLPKSKVNETLKKQIQMRAHVKLRNFVKADTIFSSIEDNEDTYIINARIEYFYEFARDSFYSNDHSQAENLLEEAIDLCEYALAEFPFHGFQEKLKTLHDFKLKFN